MAKTCIELKVSMPIVNPETKGVSRTFVFMGKVDKFVPSALGQVVDYKAVSSIARFIHAIKVGNQPYLYAAAIKYETGIMPLLIEYRLVQIPTISLCSKDDGDPAKYEERVMEEYGKHPERVRPLEITLNPSRVEHALQALWDTTKRVLDNRKSGKWRMNEKACFQYNRPCEFADLCVAAADGADVDEVIERDFVKKDYTHPELGLDVCDPTLPNACKEIMTYSRMTTTNLCEMMDYWKYERCLTHPGDNPEAMWLGRAMHEGLEAKDDFRSVIRAVRDRQPAVGEMVQFWDQQEARAVAMVRAAQMRWADEP